MRGDMKKLILLPILFMLCSCSSKITYISLCNEIDEYSDGAIELLIEGSSVRTETDQKSDGTLDLDIPLDKLTF